MEGEQLAKVSDALTKGVALLVAVLGIVAARDGGIGRLAANGGGFFAAALLLVLASVVAAFASWTVAARNGPYRRWQALVAVSIVAFAASAGCALGAQARAADQLERPRVTLVAIDGGLSFTASLDLLTADQHLRTTVYGYPAVADGAPRTRSLLFNSTTGPDAQGRATVSGTVRQDLGGYEVVEVRAHRGERDPGCERPIASELEPDGSSGMAGCASLWIRPRVEGG